jgi:hypothetical protein
MLLNGRYLRLLLLSVLLGAPVALVCFLFVGLQHRLQHEVWTSLPRAVGYDEAPWWWPLPAPAPAGLILAPIVFRAPGRGGHLPVNGLGGTPVGPRMTPDGIVSRGLPPAVLPRSSAGSATASRRAPPRPAAGPAADGPVEGP